MALLRRTASCALLLAAFAFISQASAQTETEVYYENTGELTTPMMEGDASSTTVAPGIGMNKLIALIVLGSVLGFLLLAVVTCGCWLCRRMRRRANPKNGDIIIDAHYSNKAHNNGSRTKVFGMREKVHKANQIPYGGGVNDGQRISYGYSPRGAGPGSPYYP